MKGLHDALVSQALFDDVQDAVHKIPVIYLHGSVGGRCSWADHDLCSHEPETLLELVRSLFGDPRTEEPTQSEDTQQYKCGD